MVGQESSKAGPIWLLGYLNDPPVIPSAARELPTLRRNQGFLAAARLGMTDPRRVIQAGSRRAIRIMKATA